MRTGPTVIVQRGDFVIADACRPLENLIRCGFANELLAGEPKNFVHVGIGFGAEGNCLFETSRISLLFGDTIVRSTRVGN